MIDTETLLDLHAQATDRNREAETIVRAFIDADPGYDLKLAAPMKTALDLAAEATRTLRRALDTRKPADVTT